VSGQVLRQAILPLLAVYGVFLAVLAVYRRTPPEARAPRRGATASGPSAPAPFLRYVAGTVAAGHATFLLIVLAFHAGLAGDREALGDALREGSMLTFLLVLPGFLALSAVGRSLQSLAARRRPVGTPHVPGRPVPSRGAPPRS
jgi:hypothetical protein